MISLIPAVLAGGLGLAFLRARKKKMTPERKKIFESALKTMKEPEKLIKLATAFEKDGLRAEGGELRKRAKVLSMPPAKKEEYRQAYKAGMKSADPTKVKKLASAFHKQGFYGSGKNLRDYAQGLVDQMKMPIGSSDMSKQPASAHGLEGNYGSDTGIEEATESVDISGAS